MQSPVNPSRPAGGRIARRRVVSANSSRSKRTHGTECPFKGSVVQTHCLPDHQVQPFPTLWSGLLLHWNQTKDPTSADPSRPAHSMINNWNWIRISGHARTTNLKTSPETPTPYRHRNLRTGTNGRHSQSNWQIHSMLLQKKKEPGDSNACEHVHNPTPEAPSPNNATCSDWHQYHTEQTTSSRKVRQCTRGTARNRRTKPFTKTPQRESVSHEHKKAKESSTHCALCFMPQKLS